MKPIYFLFAAVPLFVVAPAFATKLEVQADAPLIVHWGAAILLYSHILGGALGLSTGLLASLVKKGSKIHRKTGTLFFYSMLVSYLIGAGVAPFLTEGQRPNFVAGVLALYLLLSGVFTAKRRAFTAGRWEKLGLVFAILITAMGATFMYMGSIHESGTVDGSPPQAFVLFIVAGSIAALGEINVLIKGSLPEKSRVIRHLWRMCFSFFIASGSLFFGQPQVFPDWFNNSLLPLLFGFLPLLFLLYWATKMRFRGI